jgi:molecular chaperone DnaK
MRNFVGIDLGTTNSAICSYDGSETRIWKSPEQNDVTPSVIYIDNRGNKYVGKRAYDAAPQSPNNSAMLFKRVMGTSTPIELSALDLSMTPEECSAEVLKVLYGYLPEEIRNDPDTGTIITVPAAFNQMQKDATMQAASMAGIGMVSIMQEPVAAVMSVMRARNSDGMFLIYDLGGGTLDVAIAESIGGRVSLLAHGGIAMCGGRDFDRVFVDSIVKPWLTEKFSLPEDFSVSPTYKQLMRLSAWATEKAKIELSSRDGAVISLSEIECRINDLDGNEIYLDIPIDRTLFDSLIAEKVAESIEATRAALANSGLTPHDMERVVFVGGPTNYKPLRDKISFELGIPGSTEVNPMTAVAEGASLFAESIEWGSQSRSRKSTRGQISQGGDLDLSFNYIARTPNSRAKIAVKLEGDVESGTEFQVDSIDTGWTSGKLPLRNAETVEVQLPRPGENIFKVFVFDPFGGPIILAQDKITITRTAATVDAIPASYSVGIEVLDKLGGRPVIDYIVRAGESLPKKGKKVFKAAESLKAGAPSSLNFKLWEGEISDVVTDNRPVGVLKISGSDIESGVIPAGADLECEFEVLDSGNINIEVSVPCIGGLFHSGKNFYSRQEGQFDYTSAAALVTDEGEKTLSRIDEISDVIDDPRLEQARKKVNSAVSLDSEESDIDRTQEAMEKVLGARQLLARIRKEHLKEIRKIDLDSVETFFNDYIREIARPSEESSFGNLIKTAQRAIDQNDNEFEHHLDEIKGKNWEILWRQDWFVVQKFNTMVESPHLFADRAQFDQLSQEGRELLRSDDIAKLRMVVAQLGMIQIGGGSGNDLNEIANIVRG